MNASDFTGAQGGPSRENCPQCTIALFDRFGGVSGAPFESLNVGKSVGDSEQNVAANREKVKARSGVKAILSAGQVHGENIYVHRGGEPETDLEVDGYDALITNETGIGLMIQHADCQAILIHDWQHQVIGAVHCGWRGSVANLAAKTVELMKREFGAESGCMKAVISPSLGPCCAEFVNYRTELPVPFRDFKVSENHFDFWKISKHQLEQCGLLPENIVLPTICTSCSTDYFSYRRACRESAGVTGRNCSVIALTEG